MIQLRLRPRLPLRFLAFGVGGFDLLSLSLLLRQGFIIGNLGYNGGDISAKRFRDQFS